MCRLLSMAVVLICMAGCYTESTNPLFTDKELVEDDSLIGDWKLNDLKATVASAGHKAYRITIQEAGPAPKTETTNLRVLKLGDHHFVDFEIPKGGRAFARIAILGDHLYMRAFSESWLEDRLRQFPKEIAHQTERRAAESAFSVKKGDRIVLTADTADLQSFVLKYVGDPMAFGEDTFSKNPIFDRVGKIAIAPSGLASKKERTYNYWYEVRMILHSLVIRSDEKPEEVAKKLDELSKSVSDIPIVGVDYAAAKCATDAARVFTSMATVIRSGNDPSKVVEAFIRGLAGDPLGVASEQIEAGRQIKQELSQCVTSFDEARILLTDRYEVEFPSIK